MSLHNPRNLGYAWSFSNTSSIRPTSTTWGTTITSGVVEAKGATTQVLSSANVGRDVFFIEITAQNGSSPATQGNILLDIMVDPAGGTAWSPVINNLPLCGVSNSLNGTLYTYKFPLWIKAGSSIGARSACSTAVRATSVGIKVSGSPFERNNVAVGTRVVTYGAVTATSQGTAVTPGGASEGAWTQLGTVAAGDAPWFWQVGATVRDSFLAGQAIACDLSIGNATNKNVVIENAMFWSDTSERGAFKQSIVPPTFCAKAGDVVYGRAQGSATPQANFTMIAFGVTG